MNILTLFSDLKNFFSSTMNMIFILLLSLNLTILFIQIKLIQDINQLEKQLKTSTVLLENEIQINRDKIHFRYFNINRSLEDIYNIKIDTKNGRIEH